MPQTTIGCHGPPQGCRDARPIQVLGDRLIAAAGRPELVHQGDPLRVVEDGVAIPFALGLEVLQGIARALADDFLFLWADTGQ